MNLSLIFSILKNFWPSTWMANIVDEAEAVPATIAGLFLVWFTIIGIAVFALVTYNKDVNANELRLTALEGTIAANTTALDCSRQDRIISHKLRELETLKQLIQRTERQSEVNRLNSELNNLEIEFQRAETKYARVCL